MARLLYQHRSARSVYEVGIEALEAARRHEVRESSASEYGTSLLGRLLTDLHVARHERREQTFRERGEAGEERVVQALLDGLPAEWYRFTPFVIFSRPDDYAQLDHLLVGPPGLIIIETKAWRGSFLARRDAWSRRAKDGWVACVKPDVPAIAPPLLAAPVAPAAGECARA